MVKVKEEHDSNLTEKEISNRLGEVITKFNLGTHEKYKNQ